MAFREQLFSVVSDIRTKMVERETCLLTLALSHTGHVDNIAEDRSGLRSASIIIRPLNNALILDNLCEYRHKSYIAKN